MHRAFSALINTSSECASDVEHYLHLQEQDVRLGQVSWLGSVRGGRLAVRCKPHARRFKKGKDRLEAFDTLKWRRERTTAHWLRDGAKKQNNDTSARQYTS